MVAPYSRKSSQEPEREMKSKCKHKMPRIEGDKIYCYNCGKRIGKIVKCKLLGVKQ